jgi:hypothetical protein
MGFLVAPCGWRADRVGGQFIGRHNRLTVSFVMCAIQRLGMDTDVTAAQNAERPHEGGRSTTLEVHTHDETADETALTSLSPPSACMASTESLEEAQAVLAALVLLAGERKSNAAYALAELLSRRGLERPCERLVAWAREA